MFSVTYLQEDGISDQNCGHRQTMGYDTSGGRREEKIISIDCQKRNYMFGGVSYAE